MFKSFFKNKAIEDESILKDEKTLSIACLLVEAAMVDESFGEDEKKVISKILMKNFDIVDEKRLKDIIDEAVENFKEASDLITYTKKINYYKINIKMDNYKTARGFRDVLPDMKMQYEY